MEQKKDEKIAKLLKEISDINPCLCGESAPKLHIRNQEDKYIFYCISCGFHTSAFESLQPAKTDWHRANKPGCTHVAEVWADRYERTGIYYLVEDRNKEVA